MALAKETYEERKKAGLCVQCGDPANGKTRCDGCSAKAKGCRDRRREKRKQAGICTECSNPVKPDTTLCQGCIDKRSAVSTARYYRNKEAGVCRFCGQDSDGKSRCESCRNNLHQHQKAWYEARKKAGLCVFCDNKAVTETLCAGCREEHRRYSQERWAQLRQTVLDHYGRECECGVDDEDLLQIDHVDGGGNEHRREIGQSNLYLWLIQNNFPDGFQILCASCNWKKRNQKGNG